LAQQGAESYWYDPSGKRVLETNSNSGEWTLYFYDIFGKRITNVPSTDTPVNVAYFGSKPLEEWRRNGYSVAYVSDRLGSVRVNSNNETFSYLPYGEEQTSTADNRVKFATYFRDSPSQDYADQRYYNPGYGRFNTSDPVGLKAVNPANPTSWNRYAYVGGDPANSIDPRGLTDVVIGGITQSTSHNDIDAFASSIGAITAFPYGGGSLPSGIAAYAGLSLDEYLQAQVVAAAIQAAAADSDAGINIFAFSGGATAFANALKILPSNIIGRINNVTYASPGIAGELPIVNGKAPTVVYGNGLFDNITTIAAYFPIGTTVIHTDCDGHSGSCEFAAAVDRAGTPCNQCSAFSAPNSSLIAQALAVAIGSAYTAVWGPGSPPYGNASWQGLDILNFIPTVEQVTSTINFH